MITTSKSLARTTIESTECVPEVCKVTVVPPTVTSICAALPCIIAFAEKRSEGNARRAKMILIHSHNPDIPIVCEKFLIVDNIYLSKRI